MRKSKYEPSPEGAALRQLRVDMDLTQRAFGEQVGYSDAAVTLIETGLYRPKATYITKVCEVFKLSLAEEQRLLSLRAQDWVQPVRRAGRRYRGSDDETPLVVKIRPLFSSPEGH